MSCIISGITYLFSCCIPFTYQSLPPQGKYNEVFSEMRQELNRIHKTITPAQFALAQKTVIQYKDIDSNIKSIQSLQDDDRRNAQINSITQAGAEGGFSANSTILPQRVEAFVSIYRRAKQKGDLYRFFTCFSKGDPCLSGKSESLYRYAALLDVGMDLDTIPDVEKRLSLPSTIFSEIIMNHFEEEHDNETLTEGMLKAHIERNISMVASEFQKKEDAEFGLAFLDFLIDRGLHEKGQSIDWEQLLGRLIHSPAFGAVYSQTLASVV